MRVALWYDFRNPARWRQPYSTLYGELLDQIAWADELDCFEGVWLSEHHFTEDGYLPAVIPMMAAIAQRTRSLRIGTQVILAPLHHPLRLAEDVAVVDQLSGGRVDLGLAPGYRRHEFDVLGIPRRERGSRTGETIEMILEAWRAERFSYEGKHFRANDVIVTPPPAQRPHPPIWVGGSSLAAAERAARFGAHFLSDQDSPPEVIETYQRARREVGGDRGGRIGTNRAIYVCDDPEEGWADLEPHLRYMHELYEAWYREGATPGSSSDADESSGGEPLSRELNIVGTPDAVVAELTRQHAATPFDLLTFWARPPGLPIGKANRSLELFAGEVEPRVRAL